MKVVHIYKDFYPISGGIENHILILSKELIAKVQVEVIVSARALKKEVFLLENILIKKIPEIARLNSMPILPTLFFELKKLKADILHFHMPFPMGDISYLLSGCNIPAVVTYHSDVIKQRISNIFYRPLQNKFLKKAKKIMVTSGQYINSSYVLPHYREKIVVVPFGVDTKFFTPNDNDELATRIREKYGERILLYVGVLRYYKGLYVLIKAMKDINAKLIIVGRGEEWKQLNDLIYREGLTQKIVMEGSVTNFNLLPYYRACDVFVLPSIYRSEAFGIVLLEAMACGKPVISTELGTGTSWVNQHGVTGLVVPPKDPKALAEAINTILNDRDLARNMGEAGRKRVLENFTKELMAERVLKVYQEVLGA